MCVCVCVCASHLLWTSGCLWTYQTGSHRRKVTWDFSAFRLRCLLRFFSREEFSRSFPSPTLKSIFSTNEPIVLLFFNHDPLISKAQEVYYRWKEYPSICSTLFYFFRSHLRPIAHNVQCYQSHLLQRCLPACLWSQKIFPSLAGS